MNDTQAIVAFVLFCLYFFPSIVASMRRHMNGKAIFVLNLLLGWTIVGWIISLVWAFTSNTRTSRASGQ